MDKKEVKKMMQDINEKHLVWHKFCEWAEHEFGAEWENNMHGHEVIEKVEEYAKTHPAISIAHCDDDLFASSILVIVPHKDMGNTVLFIPQLTTRTNRFFIYPNHQRSLMKALDENIHIDSPTKMLMELIQQKDAEIAGLKDRIINLKS